MTEFTPEFSSIPYPEITLLYRNSVFGKEPIRKYPTISNEVININSDVHNRYICLQSYTRTLRYAVICYTFSSPVPLDTIVFYFKTSTNQKIKISLYPPDKRFTIKYFIGDGHIYDASGKYTFIPEIRNIALDNIIRWDGKRDIPFSVRRDTISIHETLQLEPIENLYNASALYFETKVANLYAVYFANDNIIAVEIASDTQTKTIGDGILRFWYSGGLSNDVYVEQSKKVYCKAKKYEPQFIVAGEFPIINTQLQITIEGFLSLFDKRFLNIIEMLVLGLIDTETKIDIKTIIDSNEMNSLLEIKITEALKVLTNDFTTIADFRKLEQLVKDYGPRLERLGKLEGISTDLHNKMADVIRRFDSMEKVFVKRFDDNDIKVTTISTKIDEIEGLVDTQSESITIVKENQNQLDRDVTILDDTIVSHVASTNVMYRKLLEMIDDLNSKVVIGAELPMRKIQLFNKSLNTFYNNSTIVPFVPYDFNIDIKVIDIRDDFFYYVYTGPVMNVGKYIVSIDKVVMLSNLSRLYYDSVISIGNVDFYVFNMYSAGALYPVFCACVGSFSEFPVAA